MATLEKKELRKLLDSQAVVDYHSQRRDQELKAKRRSYKTPALAAAAIGLGYGAKRFGDWVISDDDLKRVNSLMTFDEMVNRQTGRANADWAGSTDFYTQYLDRAGRAAQARGFGGRSAGDLMVAYRKHIEPLIGGKYPVANKKDEDAAWEHYNTFASGPAQAFIHQVKSYTLNKPEAERSQLMDTVTKNFSSSAAKYLGKDPATVERDFSDLKTPLNREQYNYGKQLDVVRNYLSSFSGSEQGPAGDWEKKHILPLIDSIRKGNASAALGYKGVKLPLNILHNVPKAVGVGLMGAGAAGLTAWGAYQLYKKITKGKRERADQALLRRQRTRIVNGFLQPDTDNMKTAHLEAALLKISGMMGAIGQGAGSGALFGGMAGAGIGALTQLVDPATRGQRVDSPDGMSSTRTYSISPEERKRLLLQRILTGVVAGGTTGALTGATAGYVVNDMQQDSNRLFSAALDQMLQRPQ